MKGESRQAFEPKLSPPHPVGGQTRPKQTSSNAEATPTSKGEEREKKSRVELKETFEM